MKEAAKSLALIGVKIAALAVHPSGDKITDEIAGVFIDKHETIKKEINEFAKKVIKIGEHFKNRDNITLPIYVMIDELDRCRPTFSIELLETIKHLFCSKYMCFIVATDSRQLEQSIKVIYGNEFDSGKYLNRFFDQEYSLPEPDNKLFSEYIFDKFKFDTELFFTPLDSSPETFEKLSDYFKLPLREQLHAASLLEAVTLTDKYKTAYNIKNIDIFFLLFLIMFRLKDKNMFNEYEISNDQIKFIKEVFGESSQFNKKVTTETSLYSKPRERGGEIEGKTTITLMTVIDKYEREKNRDLNLGQLNPLDETNKVYRKIAQRIYEQAPIRQQQKSVYSDLAMYLDIVKQIGQLSL